jgi:hypothetical protein
MCGKDASASDWNHQMSIRCVNPHFARIFHGVM